MKIIPGLVAALLFFGQNQTLPGHVPVVIPELRWELLQLGPQGEDVMREIFSAGFEML